MPFITYPPLTTNEGVAEYVNDKEGNTLKSLRFIGVAVLSSYRINAYSPRTPPS